MCNLKRILAGLIAVSAVMSTSVSCGKSDGSSESEEAQAVTEPYKGHDDVDVDLSVIGGDEGAAVSGEKKETDPNMTIIWLCDYDINPSGNNDRSVALTIFEDYYGGKVNYVSTTAGDKFDKLASMIVAGDDVDMFPYEWDAVPNGVMKNQYEPLDPYFDTLEIDSDLWDDMSDVIDMFEYKGQHYVVPYTICDPLLITYSRKMMQAEGLDDPYELYEDGEWDWDAFMDMMEKSLPTLRAVRQDMVSTAGLVRLLFSLPDTLSSIMRTENSRTISTIPKSKRLSFLCRRSLRNSFIILNG